MPNKVLSKCFLALLAAYCTATVPDVSRAEWRDLHGTLHQDTDSAKGVGQLSLQLFVRKDLKETIAGWGQVANAIVIYSQPTFKRNEPVYIMVGFNGCTKSADNSCDLTVKYSVLTPEGRICKESVEAEVWQRKDPNVKNVFMPGVGYLKFTADASDMLGEYIVEATVTDKVGNTSTVLKRRFWVTE